MEVNVPRTSLGLEQPDETHTIILTASLGEGDIYERAKKDDQLRTRERFSGLSEEALSESMRLGRAAGSLQVMAKSMRQLPQQGRKKERYMVLRQRNTRGRTLQPWLRN